MLLSTALAMWREFQQVGRSLDYGQAAGKGHTPRRERFHHVSPLINPLRAGPPTRVPFNGDDRMAADHEQSHVTSNSACDLLRQVTSFFVTQSHRGNTSSKVDLPASLCHRAHTAGPGCTNSWNSASGHQALFCLLSAIAIVREFNLLQFRKKRARA